jgi:hypothetical protein
MKDNIIRKYIKFIIVIVLYYITKNNGMYIYLLSLFLYGIYSTIISHISIYNTIKDKYYVDYKNKIFKMIVNILLIINLFFLLINILISDITNNILRIDNTFLVFLVMSFTISLDTFETIILDYIRSFKYHSLANKLDNLYKYTDIFLYIIIAILSFKVFSLPIYISISLLYLSKIISFILFLFISIIKINKITIKIDKNSNTKVDYKKESNYILKTNLSSSVISTVELTYYYLSFILMYVILLNRYNYDSKLIENNLLFTYFYSLCIMNFVNSLVKKYCPKSSDFKNNIFNLLYYTLPLAILFSIISPSLFYLIFNNNTSYIYLIIIMFLGIIVSIYKESYKYIKNNKLIYISLIIGIAVKLLLLIPFVDAVYRMGFDLIYGDVFTTIIGMTISIIINYTYIKNKYRLENEGYIDKYIKVIYQNIILFLILILLAFILPIKNDNKLLSILVILVYTFITFIYIKLQKRKG